MSQWPGSVKAQVNLSQKGGRVKAVSLESTFLEIFSLSTTLHRAREWHKSKSSSMLGAVCVSVMQAAWPEAPEECCAFLIMEYLT